jgi:hypothetical protein
MNGMPHRPHDACRKLNRGRAPARPKDSGHRARGHIWPQAGYGLEENDRSRWEGVGRACGFSPARRGRLNVGNIELDAHTNWRGRWQRRHHVRAGERLAGSHLIGACAGLIGLRTVLAGLIAHSSSRRRHGHGTHADRHRRRHGDDEGDQHVHEPPEHRRTATAGPYTFQVSLRIPCHCTRCWPRKEKAGGGDHEVCLAEDVLSFRPERLPTSRLSC